MIRVVSCILFLLMCLSQAMPQGYPVPVNYHQDQHSVNPAYAGYNKHFTTSLYYKNNWVGFPGSPVTGFFSAHTPLFGSSAVGLVLLFDQLAVKQNNQYYLDYVHRISFAGSSLALGLRMGVEQFRFDWSSVESVNPDDLVFFAPAEIYTMPNVGFGLLYQRKDFYLGFSLPEIFYYAGAEGRYSNASYADYQYYQMILTSGFSRSVAQLTVSPSSMMWYSLTQGFHANAALQVDFSRLFALGAGYQWKQSMFFFMEYPISKQLAFSYAFHMNTNELSQYSYGSHEIMLNFQFIYSEKSLSPRL